MRLTVLGNASRYLAPFSGGTSYMVEEGETRLLLDCGGGTRETLALEPRTFDAVVLSHFHHDHVLDLTTIRDAFTANTRFFLPPGETVRFQDMANAFAFRGDFALPGTTVEARPGEVHEVGPLKLTFAPTRHSAPSIATRIEGHDGAVLVYAGDTAPCEALEELARGADWLLMHTLLPTVEPDSSHARRHATAETAGALAKRARVRRLLLSHRYHESDDEEMLAKASDSCDATLARERETYFIRPGSGRS